MLNKIANGHTSEGPRKVLTSCRLIALDKGETPLAIRPIAIGAALRRIMCRCMCIQDNAKISTLFAAVGQYGIAVKGGLDLAYHLINSSLVAMMDDHEAGHDINIEASQNGGDPANSPGALTIDYTNGFNSFSRPKMLSQVQDKMPEWLRFVRYCYAQPAELVVMHQGTTRAVIPSLHGTQQGDGIGCHLFGFGIYGFMEQFTLKFKDSLVNSMIIDDQTLAGGCNELSEAAVWVATEGPKYGLFPKITKLHHFSSVSTAVEDQTLTGLGYDFTDQGFEKLLGAPLGTPEFVTEHATARALEKVNRARHLHRIQDGQLETALFKYCVCTSHLHLLRMVHPDQVAPAMLAADAVLRTEFQRQVSSQCPGAVLTDHAWELAKQPVHKEGGLEFQNPAVVADAAYTATLARVARLSQKLKLAPDGSPIHFVNALYDTISNSSSMSRVMQRLGAQINPQDGSSPICPTVEDLEFVPSQHILSTACYKANGDKLLSDPVLTPAQKARLLSARQPGAGSWVQAIPTIRVFRIGALAWNVMLLIRLLLPIPLASKVEACKCRTLATSAAGPYIRDGSHWATQCPKSNRISRHNRIRDVIKHMYSAIDVCVGVECMGLYQLLTTHGSHKPADILVPASHTDNGRAWALDITVVDPSLPSFLANQHTATVPLAAANLKYRSKMRSHTVATDQATAQGLVLPFDKYPLVFESTGAYGKHTLMWFNDMVKHHMSLHLPSLRAMGLAHTFTANSFSSFWGQRLSMVQALHHAESVVHLLHESLPHVYGGAGGLLAQGLINDQDV